MSNCYLDSDLMLTLRNLRKSLVVWKEVATHTTVVGSNSRLVTKARTKQIKKLRLSLGTRVSTRIIVAEYSLHQVRIDLRTVSALRGITLFAEPRQSMPCCRRMMGTT